MPLQILQGFHPKPVKRKKIVSVSRSSGDIQKSSKNDGSISFYDLMFDPESLITKKKLNSDSYYAKKYFNSKTTRSFV